MLVRIPPLHYPTLLFNVLGNCASIRRSVACNRRDVAEALAFGVGGQVMHHIELDSLSTITEIF